MLKPDPRFRSELEQSADQRPRVLQTRTELRSQSGDHRPRRPQDVSLRQATVQGPWSEIEIAASLEGSRHPARSKTSLWCVCRTGRRHRRHDPYLRPVLDEAFLPPSEFTKVGETIDIVILEIDKDNRKLSSVSSNWKRTPGILSKTYSPLVLTMPPASSAATTMARSLQLPYGMEAFARSNIHGRW